MKLFRETSVLLIHQFHSDGSFCYHACFWLVFMYPIFMIGTGFTFRGFAPHQNTPMQGAHNHFHQITLLSWIVQCGYDQVLLNSHQ